MERSKGRRPVRARQAMALPKRGAGTLGPASSGGLRVRVAYQMGMTGISI